jgi:hypothetical protein
VDTAPSSKSAKTTLPETGSEIDERLYLIEELAKLPERDLVRIGLASLAILHQRILDSEKDDDSEDS